MTFNTSAVAVCCCSNSRAVRSATARSQWRLRPDSERLRKSDVFFLERSHLGTADQDHAEHAAFDDQRHGEGGTASVPDRQFPPERRLSPRPFAGRRPGPAAGRRWRGQLPWSGPAGGDSSLDGRSASPNDTTIRYTSLSTMAISTTRTSQIWAVRYCSGSYQIGVRPHLQRSAIGDTSCLRMRQQRLLPSLDRATSVRLD